jgi:competence protein ComEA
VVVHVAGAVRKPGLYEFPHGARIADAIETAGGASTRADLDALNLAELLVDGSQIVVPRTESGMPGSATTVGAPGSSASPTVVSLNGADTAMLETIPGIGPVTAQAIVDHRSQIGGFGSVDELLDVDGIGPATLESIRPYLSL